MNFIISRYLIDKRVFIFYGTISFWPQAKRRRDHEITTEKRFLNTYHAQGKNNDT